MISSRTPVAAALAAALAVVSLAGCKAEPKPEPEAPTAPDAVAASATDQPVAEAPASAAPETPEPAADGDAPAAPFDLTTLPVTDEPLGEWPYLAMPEGYEYPNGKTLDLSRVPFWTGQGLEFVEGKVFLSRIGVLGEKNYSRFEVLKRIDQALTALGASRITTSKVPEEVLDKELPENFGVEFNAGAGGYYGGQEVSTYVIRHADRVVWFKIYSDGGSGSVLIAEGEPPAAAGT